MNEEYIKILCDKYKVKVEKWNGKWQVSCSFDGCRGCHNCITFHKIKNGILK